MILLVKVAQSCLTLWDPMDDTVYGILQTRIMEWVALPFSRGSSQPRDRTQVSCIVGGFFTSWAKREALILLNYRHTPICGDHFSSSVQSLSVQIFVTPLITARQASLSITNSRSILKLISIESVMPSNHRILCHPLLLPPSIFPSIRVFSNEWVLHIRWPVWSFSLNISSSNEHPRLISFRMDWLDLLAVQGTLKSLFQHHSSKASILRHSTVQLSCPYRTTGKTIALTRWTFVGKVMSLLFNMLSKLVLTFLPRNKRLLISWLQSPSAVILEPKKIKSDTVSASICHEVMGCYDLSFLNVEL